MKSIVTSGLALTLIAVGLLVPQPCAAQERPPVVRRAEDCLRRNVDRIVAVETNLASAANFLVNFTCASEVAGASKYYRNVAWLEGVTSMMKAMPAPPAAAPGAPRTAFDAMSSEIKAVVDPESGDFILPVRKAGEPQNPFEAMLPQLSTTNAQIMPDTPPPELRKLAGDLVLAARERRAR
jgi:hypothetical protein